MTHNADGTDATPARIKVSVLRGKTKQLAQRVREALLALPDPALTQTITGWLTNLEHEAADLEWLDECRFLLGWQVQSDDSSIVYGSWDGLFAAEPDPLSTTFVEPFPGALRRRLSDLTIEQFYHTVIALAGEAFALDPLAAWWGDPPSMISDGYRFMTRLANHLTLLARGQAAAADRPLTVAAEGESYFTAPRSTRRRRRLRLRRQ